MKERLEQKVILMAGGTASGKSEYVSEYLINEEVIILDGTLPSLHGASIKIDRAHKVGKEVEVHQVVPADFTVAFVVFLNRERQFASSHFFRTHTNSRKTVLKIAQQFPNVLIKIIESDVDFVGDGGKMSFREIELNDRAPLLDFLHQNQYNETQIREAMYHDL